MWNRSVPCIRTSRQAFFSKGKRGSMEANVRSSFVLLLLLRWPLVLSFVFPKDETAINDRQWVPCRSGYSQVSKKISYTERWAVASNKSVEQCSLTFVKHEWTLLNTDVWRSIFFYCKSFGNRTQASPSRQITKNMNISTGQKRREASYPYKEIAQSAAEDLEFRDEKVVFREEEPIRYITFRKNVYTMHWLFGIYDVPDMFWAETKQE